MTRTFAMDVIEIFSPEDAEAFRDFLQSPFFNKGVNVGQIFGLFEALYECTLNTTMDSVEKDQLFEAILPGKTYVEGKIDKLMTDLKRLLEQFLLARRYFSAQNEGAQQLDLAAEMRQLRLNSRYELALEKVKKRADAIEHESTSKLFFTYQIELEKHEWLCTYNNTVNDLNIPKTVNALEQYFYSKKTWLLNHFIFQHKATALAGDISVVDLDNWEVPRHLLDENAFLYIHWQIYQLLRKPIPEEKDFYFILDEIKLVEKKLDYDSLSELSAYVRNLCILLYDNGQPHLRKTLLDIYKDHISKGYLYNKHSKISPNAYLNITLIAVAADDISWANEFVEQNRHKLTDNNENEDFYRLSKAICLFTEKNFEASLEYLPFNTSHPLYHVVARCWELKIYYELKSDLVEYKIDAFKMFVSRTAKKYLIRDRLESFSNFANFMLQLHQSQGFSKKRAETLVERINAKTKVSQRDWLLEKAREIGGKSR